MNWYYLEKEFYDYADNIEGVNIHYVWTPLGGSADWENQRATRFMPLVQLPPQQDHGPSISASVAAGPFPRLRKKILKLPLHLLDAKSGALTGRYLLHHYFEIFQDGHRSYSPLYTEEIVTDAGVQSPAHETAAAESSFPLLTAVLSDVKEAKL